MTAPIRLERAARPQMKVEVPRYVIASLRVRGVRTMVCEKLRGEPRSPSFLAQVAKGAPCSFDSLWRIRTALEAPDIRRFLEVRGIRAND